MYLPMRLLYIFRSERLEACFAMRLVQFGAQWLRLSIQAVNYPIDGRFRITALQG